MEKIKETQLAASELYSDIYTKKIWIFTGIAFLVSLLLFVSYSYLISITTGSNKPYEVWANIILSIAGGIAASVIFTTFQTLFTNKQILSLFTEKLKEESNKNKNEILEGHRIDKKEYMPTKIFESTNNEDDIFNQDIDFELMNTRNFYFKGVTGVYSAIRLHNMKKQIDSVKLILANPIETTAISYRVSYDMNLNNKDSEDDYNASKERITKDIYVGLVGLFYSRRKCDKIEVVFQDNNTDDRVEIFDNSLYLAIYFNETGKQVRFPKTLKFNKDSVFFGIYLRNFFREFRILECDNKIVMDINYSEQNLITDLKRFGLNSIDDKELFELKKVFLEREQAFLIKAKKSL